MEDKTGVKTVRVAARLCNACGVCREICGPRAIRIGNVARIAAERCTGCGACVDISPTGAIVPVGGREDDR